MLGSEFALRRLVRRRRRGRLAVPTLCMRPAPANALLAHHYRRRRRRVDEETRVQVVQELLDRLLRRTQRERRRRRRRRRQRERRRRRHRQLPQVLLAVRTARRRRSVPPVPLVPLRLLLTRAIALLLLDNLLLKSLRFADLMSRFSLCRSALLCVRVAIACRLCGLQFGFAFSESHRLRTRLFARLPRASGSSGCGGSVRFGCCCCVLL